MRRLTRYLTVALVSLSAASAAPAQQAPSARAPVRLGVMGGPSIATYGATDLQDYGRRTGAVVGGYAVLGIVPRLAIQTELLYSMKGIHGDGGVRVDERGATPVTYTTKLDYVETPVLARIALAPPGRFTPYVLVGPTVAVRARCRSELEAPHAPKHVDDCGSVVRRVDAGALVGAGLVLGGFGAGALNVGARYDVGLTRIVAGSTARNRVLSLTAGFEAPLR